MTNTRPTPSVVADEGLVAVREILWDALQTVYADGHDGNALSVDADQLARAALAASDRDVLVAENERLREALEGIAGAVYLGPADAVSTWRSLANACQQTARAALVPLGAATFDSPRESSI